MGIGNLNERQVDLRSTSTSNYTNLKSYLDGKQVISGPFDFHIDLVTTDVVKLTNAVSTVSGGIGALTIGLGSATTQSFGALIATSATLFGTAGVDTFADGIGNILNRVGIRNKITNEPLSVSSGVNQGKEVFGLIQGSATSEGVAVGAALSENVQISFVYFDITDTLQTYALSGINSGGVDIEFNLNFVYARRDLPNIYMAGGSAISGGLDETQMVQVLESSYEITTAAATGETMTLSTGAFSGTGVSTQAGDVIVLPATDVLTYADKEFDVELNGISLKEGTGAQVEYVSAGSIKFNVILDIGDRLVVRSSKI